MEARQALDQGLIGAQIDKYHLVEEVGYGGMAVVYRAEDDVLGREVAVKVLHSHLAKRDEARRRFEREARAVAKLSHPNIVEIYDFSGEDSPHSYIVTEFIRGLTLRDCIDGSGLPFPEVGVMIAIQVAEALAHAHELGVLHRDVKPENVMIRTDGVVKLMDFGIAQVRDAQRMTETGHLLGSPAHMAPEVVSGEEPDARSDIFSFGTVLYYLVTGDLPFTGRNAAVVLRTIVEGRYVDPEMKDPKIGQGLGGIIRKCLARDPGQRYGAANEVVAALRACSAEVGLVDVVSELRQYFAAPEVYSEALRKRLVVELERKGRASLERHEIARAVDSFNRVLAIDDHHEGVRKLLGRLDRRRKLAAYGLALSAVLAVAAVVVLAAGVLSPSTPVQWTPDEVAQAINSTAFVVGEAQADGLLGMELELQRRSERLNAAMTEAGRIVGATAANTLEIAKERARQATIQLAMNTSVVAGRVASDMARLILTARAETEVPEEEEERGRSGGPGRQVSPEDEPVAVVEPPEPQRVRVTLRPWPRGVRFSVDGTEYGDLGEYPGGVPLSPGRHIIEYTHPLARTDRQIISVDADAEEVIAEPFLLQWLDASLKVDSAVAGRVIIGREDAGDTGEWIRVPIDVTEHRLGLVEVEVAVIPNIGGDIIHVGVVELQAGDRRTVEARAQ